jgi:hypothetical protein
MLKISDIIDALHVIIQQHGDLEIDTTKKSVCYKSLISDDASLKLRAETLKITIPCDDFFLDDHPELRPYVVGENVILKINLKSGFIEGWGEKIGFAVDFFEKIVDAGSYWLIDADGNGLIGYCGYVPNKVIPEKDGYGDYIDLKINEFGVITNWYEDYSLQEFIDQMEADW